MSVVLLVNYQILAALRGDNTVVLFTKGKVRHILVKDTVIITQQITNSLNWGLVNLSFKVQCQVP